MAHPAEKRVSVFVSNHPDLYMTRTSYIVMFFPNNVTVVVADSPSESKHIFVCMLSPLIPDNDILSVIWHLVQKPVL